MNNKKPQVPNNSIEQMSFQYDTPIGSPGIDERSAPADGEPQVHPHSVTSDDNKLDGLHTLNTLDDLDESPDDYAAPNANGKAKAKSKKGKSSSDEDTDEDEDIDELDSLADELEAGLSSDLEDAATEELAALLAETGGNLVQRVNTLDTKLKLFPDGDFPISEYSQYGDKVWVLFKNRYGTAKRVHFENLSEPMIALKKAIVYHVIPEFAPFGAIRSFTTTQWQANLFYLLDRYIFKENFLDGDAQSIAVINSNMLRRSLDLAKNTASSLRHYLSLFYLIRLWGSLSTQGLMPEGLALHVDMRTVDTVERQKDVIRFSGSLSSWKPYSEEDLGSLVSHAIFWTGRALPSLLKLVDYVKENKIDEAKKAAIVRYSPDPVVEENFNVVVDGKPIVVASKNMYRYENQQGRPFKCFVYNWINSYSIAIDNVRNALYILLALMTGLRVSELQHLRFEDVTEDGDGNYTLRVARFKTSHDPNEHGDEDFLPLPKYVGDKLKDLSKLRSAYTLVGQGYIFQSCKGRRVINKPSAHMLQQITRELEEQTGVDRVHTHRFRKTIAEILINRSERNIDIIRHLFGHHSYAMTLKYIGRNPYFVRSVAQAIEQNYTEEFTELITAITTARSSGEGADRLLDRIRERPGAFKGKQLQATIFTYISHLLSAGEPIFIHRTAVGNYCLSTETYSSPNLPPCLAARKGEVTNALPDPNWCDVSCVHAVVVEKAKMAMQDNVRFWVNMLENADAVLSERSKKMLRDKIAGHTKHLERLDSGVERIPVEQVLA
ncbi:site-specific integrase [Pseudomonas viridiflava]|uniref:site-specific integrase n=1 Tax=Pseudomonas viridiflava TaxID=33069 RepID=UPI001E48886F|nr:site-specific integrase [Pseudomonas viridiflava]